MCLTGLLNKRKHAPCYNFDAYREMKDAAYYCQKFLYEKTFT